MRRILHICLTMTALISLGGGNCPGVSGDTANGGTAEGRTKPTVAKVGARMAIALGQPAMAGLFVSLVEKTCNNDADLAILNDIATCWEKVPIPEGDPPKKGEKLSKAWKTYTDGIEKCSVLTADLSTPCRPIISKSDEA